MTGRNKSNPLARGIFFVLCVICMGIFTLCIESGCSKPKPSPKKESEQSADKGFILMGNRGSILESPLEMMKSSSDYVKDSDGLFNRMKIDNQVVSVEIDVENAYACSYTDGRRVVYYPVKQIILPKKGEKTPFGFFHYFDAKGMSMFFQVVVGFPVETEQPIVESGTVDASEYQAWFLSPKNEPYGLIRCRTFKKSDLTNEEAFRKFNSSRRTVLIGTNSLDENKFLFIFLKIPEWQDKIFQIFQWWY